MSNILQIVCFRQDMYKEYVFALNIVVKSPRPEFAKKSHDTGEQHVIERITNTEDYVRIL